MTTLSRVVPYVTARRLPARVGALPTALVSTGGFLVALVLLSLIVKLRGVGGAYWIDEGLSVGISSFPLTEIPGVLRQDGSPPLYYLLLHGWMELFGQEERATNVLSLIFALLTVPAGLWAGWSLFGRREGWFCAAVCALNPFVTYYAHETRMYALLALLGLVATTAFLLAFVFDRRRHLITLAAALALMLYTHNWTLFFIAAAALALLLIARERPEHRRRLLRDGALVLAAAAAAYAPWVPTLVFQATHTGAPWANVPGPGAMLDSVVRVLGGHGPAVALLLAGGAGLTGLVGGRRGPARTALLAAAVLAAGTLVIAWASSQLSPAWAMRYLAVLVGPLLLVAGVGLARAGRLGLAALAVIALFWAFMGDDVKSRTSEKRVLREVELRVDRGDLVISTHPERLPVLHSYLPDGLRYATPLGPAPEPRVMDWVDALDRLRAARTRPTLAPLLAKLAVGENLLIVRPNTDNGPNWESPWTSLVRRRSSQWARAISRDPRFVRRVAAPAEIAGATTGVRAALYTKVRD